VPVFYCYFSLDWKNQHIIKVDQIKFTNPTIPFVECYFYEDEVEDSLTLNVEKLHLRTFYLFCGVMGYALFPILTIVFSSF
jgi:hypothetical protein